ncbi:MarR family winged helix-turn-helix transcriptional regulator [Agromyces seonyuensis]|uniref:MarR family transcriptional regulator n=1 Tax=Agromyces seonyuensis TaxID=2662446 RepID=A0A6I4P0G5_9MICO|nr:MarR family transcriptional regulator [Agromyces seonyuensis]MWB99861.1 MarR family transcriptional regulator [Agromyces seonyuensis]
MATPFTPATSPLGDHLTVTLHELVDRIDSIADAALREHVGIGYSWFEFLAILANNESDGHPDLTELASCLHVSKAAVSKRLPAFLEAGYVLAQPDPANARRLVLRLTDEGRALVARSMPVLADAFESEVAGLPLDLGRLNAELTALVHHLDAPKGTAS